MFLRPCRGCSFSPSCLKKKELLKSLRGLGLTSVSFPCKMKFDLFGPGVRVQADFEVYDRVEHHSEKVTISGTIMKRKGQRLMVWLDEPIREDAKGAVIRVKLDQKRLTLLDERIREVCSGCGKPDDQDNESDWFCETCNPEQAGLIKDACYF